MNVCLYLSESYFWHARASSAALTGSKAVMMDIIQSFCFEVPCEEEHRIQRGTTCSCVYVSSQNEILAGQLELK